LLIQNGESLAYIKDQLGHSSIKMTVDVYGHLVPGANRQAVNRCPASKMQYTPLKQSLPTRESAPHPHPTKKPGKIAGLIH
jgi:integrase